MENSKPILFIHEHYDQAKSVFIDTTNELSKSSIRKYDTRLYIYYDNIESKYVVCGTANVNEQSDKHVKYRYEYDNKKSVLNFICVVLNTMHVKVDIELFNITDSNINEKVEFYETYAMCKKNNLIAAYDNMTIDKKWLKSAIKLLKVL